MWCNAGKPRQGQIFELYRQSKSICKYAIRYIKRHENSLRKEYLARKLVDKNPIIYGILEKVKHECEQYSASHMHCSRVAQPILPIVNPEMFTSAWFFD